jgi:hypothetical protein
LAAGVVWGQSAPAPKLGLDSLLESDAPAALIVGAGLICLGLIRRVPRDRKSGVKP